MKSIGGMAVGGIFGGICLGIGCALGDIFVKMIQKRINKNKPETKIDSDTVTINP